VTSGRLNGGNFAGVATRAQSKGDLAEDGPDRWAPAGSDWGEHGIRAETL
jgi:hypothetical protein